MTMGPDDGVHGFGGSVREDRQSDVPGGESGADFEISAISADSRARVEPAAVWTEIAALKPWVRNPKKITDADVRRVVQSIRRFGFGAPIVARKADREVMAGHARLLAAQELGLRRVPVRYLDLDPADAHLYALADNKLAEFSEWEDEEVAEILSEYSEEDARIAGFDEKELDKLGKSIAEGDEPEPVDMGEQFSILIECRSEKEQVDLLSRFQAEGLQCRALT